MKFSFKATDANAVVAAIKTALSGRKLGEMVDFGMRGADLVVTISKMGTSELVFTKTDSPNGMTFALTKEKIAFAHHAFKSEVKEKLCRIVEQAGGKLDDERGERPGDKRDA